MSIENLLNYSVDNAVINHYLHLLAERDVKAAQRNADLSEKLRLSEQALVEVHKASQTTRAEANKQQQLTEQQLLNALNDLKELESAFQQTQQRLMSIEKAHQGVLLKIKSLETENDKLKPYFKPKKDYGTSDWFNNL